MRWVDKYIRCWCKVLSGFRLPKLLKLVNFWQSYSKKVDILETECSLFVMVALCNRADHYIFTVWFLSSFFLSFFPRLISAAVDWMSTILHTWCGLSANLGCRSETCCTRLAENTGRKKVAKNRHLGTIAQLSRAISSQLRHVSTTGKKLVKQRYVLHTSSQYGELRPTNGWDPSGSLRHPCKFQRLFRHGSVTARHLVVGVSQTLRRWTEGASYVRQGDHQVGHWPTL